MPLSDDGERIRRWRASSLVAVQPLPFTGRYDVKQIPVRSQKTRSIWVNSEQSFYVHKDREIFILDGQVALVWSLINGERNLEDIHKDLPVKLRPERLAEIVKSLFKRKLLRQRPVPRN